jgi:hypothetical protein
MNSSTKRSVTTVSLLLVLGTIVTGSLFAVSPAHAGWINDLINDAVDGAVDRADDIYDYTIGGMVEQRWYANISAQQTSETREHYRDKADAELFRICVSQAESQNLLPGGTYPSAYTLIVARPGEDGQSTDCFIRQPR